ncbi:MAG TPA: metal-dependent hydrolase [bacterium]|nr:metal-dependent hydrolase [bacterium]
MNTIYHLQAGSFIANARDYNLRERRLIMLASLAPDADGIFFFSSDLWNRFHHSFSHNIFSMLIVAAALALYNRSRRIEIFAVCAVSAILQIFIDVVTNDLTWPQQFLRPLTDAQISIGSLTDWKYLNTLQVVWVQGFLMIVILVGTVILYKKTGRTFLELISPRLDRLLTDFIVLFFTRRCAVCNARALYRDTGRGDFLCANHARVRRDLTISRKNVGGEDGTGDHHD